MAAQPLSEELKQQARDAFKQHGTIAGAARALGLPRGTYQSRLEAARLDGPPRIQEWTYEREKSLWLDSGLMVVFSDAHVWPGDRSVAANALVKLVRKLKPRAVIANGDVFDGASVSRHDPFGWSCRPTVKQELDACIDLMSDIEQAAPRGCQLLWNIGNHCQRFERTLASRVPEFAGMGLTRLADHFPSWEMQWSIFVNKDGPHPVMVKHRNAGGIHSSYNNTLRGGITTVTGHTHLLEVKPWGDYRGRRYGVATGTLQDLHHPSFEYHENAPSAACSGFAVLTFKDGHLMHPEICEVIGDKAWFRGEIVA